MIERAPVTAKTRSISFLFKVTGFFRDSFGQEFYLRKLAKHDVRLLSITQPLGNDEYPAQAIIELHVAQDVLGILLALILVEQCDHLAHHCRAEFLERA